MSDKRPTALSKLEIIRAYTRAGYALMPLRGKMPTASRWRETKVGQYSAEELAKGNYGVILSPTQVVIDCDPRNFEPGDRPLGRLTSAAGPLDSFTVRTGGKKPGLHIYLTVPEGFKARGKHPQYAGLDIKHHGGYVVGPGSVHPDTGKLYEVCRGTPEKMAAASTAQLEILKAVPVYIGPGTGTYMDDAETQARYAAYLQIHAPTSGSFVVACKGRDLGLPPERTLSLMLEVWNPRRVEPRDEAHMRDRVAHAYKFAKGALGADNPAAQFDTIEGAKAPDGERPSVTPQYSRDVGMLVPVDLSTLQEPAPARILLGGRLAAGHPNTLYAEGGQGKSFIALDIATCTAAGLSFCGLDLPNGPVLYLDWELSADAQAHRAFMIARGLGLKAPPKGLLYLAPPKCLPDLIAALKELVQKEKPVLIVVDSMGPASGGNPEDAKETIALFNALRSFGVTSLILDHQAKLQQGQDYKKKTVFGSVYKFNLSRSVIHLERIASAPGELRLILRHTKSNFGPYAEDLALLVRFSSDSWKFEVVDQAKDPAFAKALTVGDKVLAALREYGKSTAETLEEKTGGAVKNELTRLRKAGKVKMAGQEGRKTLWALTETSVPTSQTYRDVTLGRSDSAHADALEGLQ